MVISGTNTNFAQASNTVAFYFNSASQSVTYPNSITVINNTTLSANLSIPSNTYGGVYDFSVSNFLDGYMVMPQSFTVNGPQAPSIASLSPNSGFAGQTLNVVITGSNTSFAQASNTIGFFFNSGSSTITFPNFSSVNNNNSITANITIPPQTLPGTYGMYLQNNLDGYLAFQPFYVTAANPQIMNVSPSSGKQGETVYLTIDAAGTAYSQSIGAIVELRKGPNIVIASQMVTVQNNYKISAIFEIPWNAATGLYDVLVTDAQYGILTANEAFEVDQGNSVQTTGVSKPGFKLYPVPFSNSLKLDYDSGQEKFAEIEIVDLTGKIVFYEKVHLARGWNTFTLWPELQSGFYYLRLKSGRQLLLQEKVIRN